MRGSKQILTHFLPFVSTGIRLAIRNLDLDQFESGLQIFPDEVDDVASVEPVVVDGDGVLAVLNLGSIRTDIYKTIVPK